MEISRIRSFMGHSNHERTLFEKGPTVTFEYEHDGNLPHFDKLGIKPEPSNAAPGQIPEAALQLNDENSTIDLTFDLSVTVDKKVKLTFNNKTEIKKPGMICTNKKRKKCYRCQLKWDLEMGAKIIHLKSRINDEQISVLRIENFNEYMNEIFLRGQIGPFEDKTQRRGIDDRGKIETFFRYIQCGISIYVIDFYDFYIYKRVGEIFDPNPEDSSSHCLYYDPVDQTNLTNQADYKFLISKIDTDTAVVEFFEVFSNLMNGNFCNVNSDKQFIMQLCLALAFSEPIRNFQTIDWNNWLNDHQDYIITHRDLRDVLHLHPMVTGGSFKHRLTGYKGKTEAASIKVEGFLFKLKTLKADFERHLGLSQRQQDGDDNGDLQVSYRPQ